MLETCHGCQTRLLPSNKAKCQTPYNCCFQGGWREICGYDLDFLSENSILASSISCNVIIFANILLPPGSREATWYINSRGVLDKVESSIAEKVEFKKLYKSFWRKVKFSTFKFLLIYVHFEALFSC
jgi:hypothetical protein